MAKTLEGYAKEILDTINDEQCVKSLPDWAIAWLDEMAMEMLNAGKNESKETEGEQEKA